MSATDKVDALIDIVSGTPPEFRDLDSERVKAFVEESWDQGRVLETLVEYVRIPNQSPDYDPECLTNGLQEQAAHLLMDWVKAQEVPGLSLEIIQEPDLPPVIFMEVEPTMENAPNVFMYGHFDKQPPLDPATWHDGLGAYKPVIRDGKLYGRGGADDGYAIFASVDCIRALKDQNLPHPRVCILIEGEEESGSPHLLDYVARLEDRIGKPDVVFCLDSGCGNYEQLWMTVCLRGIAMGFLRASLLKEGIHSGNSGVVRCSFHVIRALLDRIDNAATGEMIPELNVEIPQRQIQYCEDTAIELGETVWTAYPFVAGAGPQLDPTAENATQLLINRTWKPQLCVTGIDGIPGAAGGNVLRSHTTLKLSIRLPPTADPNRAIAAVKEYLERKPTPFNANVTFDAAAAAPGFLCPEFQPWLWELLDQASNQYFGKPALCFGEGGTIPFMGELLGKFPEAQFVITGVLGPEANAHGPNEFLEIEYCKRVVSSMANVLYGIGRHGS